jgi:hypothetical protein
LLLATVPRESSGSEALSQQGGKQATGGAVAVVELITVGPHHPIETRFGHILLRVIDTKRDRDDAYDFGVAAFYEPDFIVKALMGRGMFRLRRSPTATRVNHYVWQDRQVESQRLNLTPSQTQHLLERLEWNLLPENVHYRYDHVVDNCSTRLRDLLDDVTDGALQRAAEAMGASSTFRDEILMAGSGDLLALIGLDLVTGMHSEQPIGAWEQSFVPQRLYELVALAGNPAQGAEVSLVLATRVLHQRVGTTVNFGRVRAGRCFVLAVGLGLGTFFGVSGFAARRSSRRSVSWGRLVGGTLGVIALVAGVLGIALLSLSEISTGHIWAPNLNAWLFVPLDLVLLVPAFRWLCSGQPGLTRWMRIYLNLRILGLTLAAGLGILGGQDNAAFALAVACVLLGLRAQPNLAVR